MNNEFNVNEIVKIEQMPIVFSQLEKIGSYIAEKTKDLDKLECTEENKVEVKNRRTEINNTLKILEDKRKEIKNKLLEPYNIFNEKYEQECKGQLEDASNLLKDKIDTIEIQQKQEKENTLREFFKQYQENYHLENIIEFEDVGLNITLSASEKSLKEQIMDYCIRISTDIKIIENSENSDELMYEYNKNGHDYQKAVLTLIEKEKQLEEIKKQKEVKQQIEEQEKKVEEVIETITAPKELIEEDEILEATFTIKTTKDKLLQLKEWLKENEIEYT